MSGRAAMSALARTSPRDGDRRSGESDRADHHAAGADSRSWPGGSPPPQILHGFDRSGVRQPAALPPQQPLTIARPDDRYEADAERAAEAFAAGEEGARPSSAPSGGSARVASGAPPEAGAKVTAAMRAGASEAQPVPQQTLFERGLGHNFSSVRIHAGPAAAVAAASIKAQAFAHGQNIFFGRGFYHPETSVGRRLIAHELAHTAEPRPNTIARRALDVDDEETQPPSLAAAEVEQSLATHVSDSSPPMRNRLSRLSPSAHGRVTTPPRQDAGSQTRRRDSRESAARLGTAPAPNAFAAGSRGQRSGSSDVRSEAPGSATSHSPAATHPPATPTPASRGPISPAPDVVASPGPGSGPDRPGFGPSEQGPARDGHADAGATGQSGDVKAVDEDDRPLRLTDLLEQPSQGARSPVEMAADAGQAPNQKGQTDLVSGVGGRESGETGATSLAAEEGGMSSAPEGDTSAVRMDALAAELETALAAAGQDMSAQASDVSARVRQHGSIARSAIRADVSQAVERITAGQTGLRSEITTRVAATHALIDASLAARKVEAVTAGLSGQQTIRDVFTGHRAQIGATVQRKIEASERLRDAKGETVRRRNREDMRAAYRMSGEKTRQYLGTSRGAYITGAVFDVAEATAVKMRDQEPEIVGAIRENVEPLRQYFVEQGASALQGFDENLPAILQSVNAGVTRTQTDQDRKAGEAHTHLTTLANQSLAEIDAVGLQAIAQTVAFGPQVEARLDLELGHALRAVAAAPQEVMRRMSPPIREAIALFRGGAGADVDSAHVLANGLKSFMSSSARSASDAMARAADACGQRFDEMRRGAQGAMHAQLQRTNGVWEGARTGIATATESLLSQFDGSISGSVGILRETLTGVEDNIRGQLSPIVAQVDRSFDDVLRDAEGKIDQRIAEGMGKNTEALGELPGKMHEAAVQAAYEFDHPVLSSVQAGLEFFAGLVAGILAVLAVVGFFLLAGWVIMAVLGVSALAAGLIILAGTIGFAIGYAFGARLAAGQGVGEAFFGAIGDFGRNAPHMLYEMTGIPKLRRAFSDERMTPYERGKLIGEGGTELVLAIFMVRGAAKGVASGFRSLGRFRSPVAAPEIAVSEVAIPRTPPPPALAAEPALDLSPDGAPPRPSGTPAQVEPRPARPDIPDNVRPISSAEPGRAGPQPQLRTQRPVTTADELAARRAAARPTPPEAQPQVQAEPEALPLAAGGEGRVFEPARIGGAQAGEAGGRNPLEIEASARPRSAAARPASSARGSGPTASTGEAGLRTPTPRGGAGDLGRRASGRPRATPEPDASPPTAQEARAARALGENAPRQYTRLGDVWRWLRYRAGGGKIASWEEWLRVSRGSRGGGPNHQAVQDRLVADGGTREVPVGNRNAADARWRQGENGVSRDTYHQIGELNEVRGDPINRERTNFEQMFNYFRRLGRDVDIWFWDRNNPAAAEPILKLRTTAPLDAQPDWIRAVKPKRGLE